MKPSFVTSIQCGLFLTISGWSQTSPPVPHPDNVPIYHVTVIDRTVSAVNYQYRGGPTEIGFKGTVLLPKGKGEGIVESRTGRTEIDAKFEHLRLPQQFGAEYLTYVLWAITPDGHPVNLGEIVANGSDKAHLRVTTELQAFGLIVTAEPYASVRQPSDVVVLENEVRPETVGSAEPIHARVELLPRGTYTYNVPASDASLNTGPKVSMNKYEQIVGIYQAQNAIQIAQSQGAGQYAAELIAKAEQQLANARQLESQHAGRSAVVSAAREASQTAEDARVMTANKKQEAQVIQAQQQAARDRQLREQAEARATQAEAQLRANNAALESPPPSQAEVTSGSAPVIQASAPPPPVPVQPQPYIAGTRAISSETKNARSNLLQQMKSSFGSAVQVIDSPRGIVAILPDADFEGARLSAPAGSAVARIAPILASTRGLTIEVDGYSDTADEAHQSMANLRAQQIRDMLVERGLTPNRVAARNMGSAHPIGPDHDQNRRIEIVISGDSIGNLPLWDKAYSLNVQR